MVLVVILNKRENQAIRHLLDPACGNHPLYRSGGILVIAS